MLCSCYAQWSSWMVLVFSTLNVIFLGGKRRAFGDFVAAFNSSFYPNVTLTELNWIGDSYSAFGCLSVSITTTIILRSGRLYRLFQLIASVFILISCISSSYVPNPHWLFLTHTLMHGIGSSFILSNVGLIINEHFDINHKRHILATTLISGGSVASILFVVFFAYLIEKYDWRVTFRILGVLYFVVIASAAIFFKRFTEFNSIENEKLKRKKTYRRYIKARNVPLVILWFIDRIFTSAVTYGLLLNLTDYIHRNGQKMVNSTTLTMLFASGEAATYLIGAIITAITKDLLKGKLKYIILVTSLLMSGSLVGAEFCIPIKWAFETLLFVVGFCLGPSITFLYPAGEEFTGLPGDLAYPISLGGMGCGMMISPLVSAKLIEVMNYHWFFLIQGGMIFIKFLALLTIIVLQLIYSRWDPELESVSLLDSMH